MFWGVRSTDTAKRSIEERYVFLDRTAQVVQYLERLRARAVSYASPRSVEYLAALVPLPELTSEDEAFLTELEPCDDLNENRFDWSDPPSGEDEYTFEAEFDQRDTGYDCAAGVGENEKSKLEEHVKPGRHILSTPWRDSLPLQLETYLDCLDNGKSPTHASIAENQEESSSTLRDPRYPVTIEQLSQLQQCLGEAQNFLDYVQQSLKNVKKLLNRREDRHRWRESKRDMTHFMKSQGLGSPLVDVIAVDEEWPDNWGVPLAKTPRKRIYFGSKSYTRSFAA